jgi:hypothetical protein
VRQNGASHRWKVKRPVGDIFPRASDAESGGKKPGIGPYVGRNCSEKFESLSSPNPGMDG